MKKAIYILRKVAGIAAFIYAIIEIFDYAANRLENVKIPTKDDIRDISGETRPTENK